MHFLFLMYLIALCCWLDFSFKCTSRCDFLLFNLRVYHVHIERKTYWWFEHLLWSHSVPPEKRLLQNNLPLSITPFLYCMLALRWVSVHTIRIKLGRFSFLHFYIHIMPLYVLSWTVTFWKNYNETMPFRICIHYSVLWWLLWSLQHCFIIIIVSAHFVLKKKSTLNAPSRRWLTCAL